MPEQIVPLSAFGAFASSGELIPQFDALTTFTDAGGVLSVSTLVANNPVPTGKPFRVFHAPLVVFKSGSVQVAR